MIEQQKAASIQYISLSETASLIRRDLKAAFPAVTFGVRSHRYTGGAAIRVHWTDGPPVETVMRVVQQYEGAHFDAMLDLKSYVDTVNTAGQRVHYGVDYVQCERAYSARFLQAVSDYLTRHYAFSEDPQFEVVEATGHIQAYVRARNQRARFGIEWAVQFLNRFCWKTAATPDGEPVLEGTDHA